MSESQDIVKLVGGLDTRLEKKFGQRKGPLVKRLRKAGAGLPRRVKADAELIGKAMEFQGHPKLRRRVDAGEVSAAHDRIAAHLDQINIKERRKDFWLSVLRGVALNALLIAALLALVLKWRGLV
ncbi:hypothetical protein N4R57_16940 [Rhodobacteraceae bacterium D3-12]|nr:hypothetical protein N4R57_16940 [Rhodobacteraceae bacterium D3-12]